MWDWLIWSGLIAGAIAAISGLVNLVIRMLQAWRDFKRTRRHLVRALDRVTESAERAAVKAEAADSVELQRSLRRLQRSLAQLHVLRIAAEEAQATFEGIADIVPKK